jgi:hypothetical protein
MDVFFELLSIKSDNSEFIATANASAGSGESLLQYGQGAVQKARGRNGSIACWKLCLSWTVGKFDHSDPLG